MILNTPRNHGLYNREFAHIWDRWPWQSIRKGWDHFHIPVVKPHVNSCGSVNLIFPMTWCSPGVDFAARCYICLRGGGTKFVTLKWFSISVAELSIPETEFSRGSSKQWTCFGILWCEGDEKTNQPTNQVLRSSSGFRLVTAWNHHLTDVPQKCWYPYVTWPLIANVWIDGICPEGYYSLVPGIKLMISSPWSAWFPHPPNLKMSFSFAFFAGWWFHQQWTQLKPGVLECMVSPPTSRSSKHAVNNEPVWWGNASLLPMTRQCPTEMSLTLKK